MAYADEGLAPDQLDEGSRTVAASRFEVQSTFGGVPVGTYLDCGSSLTGRPLVESARIQATIISRVAPVGTSASQISTRFEGIAFPTGGSEGRAQDCYTTGELERMLVARVRSALSDDSQATPAMPTSPTGSSVSSPLSNGPSAASTADFPVEPGTRVRLHTSPTERYTGTFLVLRNDTVLVRRSRVTGVPYSSVSRLEVQQTNPASIALGAAVGAVSGIALFVGTDLGISGRHEAQGRLLNPGLGAVVGGLSGAFLASKLFGSKWEQVPLEVQALPEQGSVRTGIGVRIPHGGPRRSPE
jgi:hypothetical protein